MLSRRWDEGAGNDEGKTMAGSWKGEQQEKGEGMSEQERSYIWSGEDPGPLTTVCKALLWELHVCA